MLKSRRNFSTREPMMPGRFLILAITATAMVALQGCSGSSNPNYPTPTTLNPAPGVTLLQIKITPTTPIMLLAQTRQLFATGIYNDGTSIDISAHVTWAASSPASTTNFVTVNSGGLATASTIGQSVITATVGPVVGVLQLTVASDGFSSGTMGILSAPFKSTEIDVGYLPQQTKILGSYAVQEFNLDADAFSSVLPVASSLKASIPMPAGFVPNAAVASQTSGLVAVISYSSQQVQIIDASNNPLDTASNTLIATYNAPVTQSVTINGITCMICAAVVNPLNNQLILSTAQGFYSMNLTTGAFTTMQFAPAPVPSANFTINPTAVPDPFIVSAVPGSGEIQILDLTTNAVTTYSNLSPAPAASTIDLDTQFASIADGDTNEQVLVDFTDPLNPVFEPIPGVGTCTGTADLNMVALAVAANGTGHALISSQTGGNCLGIQSWPNPGVSLNPTNVFYGYGPVPSTPDGNPFVNGSDPNTIAAFNSVYDKNTYAVLVDANQQWVAKINFGPIISFGNLGSGGPTLPAGLNISSAITTGVAGDPVVFLPTPSTTFTLSTVNIPFGTVSVGTSSPQIPVTLSNIGTATLLPQVSLQGSNAGDFSFLSNCPTALFTQTNCAIDVTFTPTATGARSAVLTVSSPGLPDQTVTLTGTGQ